MLIPTRKKNEDGQQLGTVKQQRPLHISFHDITKKTELYSWKYSKSCQDEYTPT